MTKEQEKAIRYVNFMSKTIKFDKSGFPYGKESLETVLNMLKEKDKEIEELKQALARNIAKNFTSSMKESAKSKEDLENTLTDEEFNNLTYEEAKNIFSYFNT